MPYQSSLRADGRTAKHKWMAVIAVLITLSTFICVALGGVIFLMEPHWPLKYISVWGWGGMSALLMVSLYGWAEIIRHQSGQSPLCSLPLGTLFIALGLISGVSLLRIGPKRTSAEIMREQIRELDAACDQAAREAQRNP